MEQEIKKEMKDIANMLLEVGTLLMSAGANTGRIRNTVTRIAETFGYNTELLITQRALTLTISDEENNLYFDILKRTPTHTVNFSIVSGISLMSWRIVEEKWTVHQINTELDRLTTLPHFPRFIILPLVALAGAAFCRLAGGTAPDMIITFIATFVGLFIRQEATKMRFNFYLCVYFAALTASLIAAGLSLMMGWGHLQEHAFATSVLFLIPGVPLINSFSDMIDGNLQNGIIRGLNGFIISFTIALGLLTAKFIYQL